MSSSLHPSQSQRLFARHGFQPLPTQHEAGNMASNDATIDIPLEQVRTQNSQAYLRPTATEQSGGTIKRALLRGRRMRPQIGTTQKTGRVGYDGEEDTINTMGMLYNKILNFSVLTRYIVYVSPLALMIAVPIIVGATVAKGAKIGGVRIVWFFTWVEVVWLSLWVSKIVAHYLSYVYEVLAGVVSSGVRKYSLVIRSLEIPLSLVGWALTSLSTFIPLMTLNPDLQELKKSGQDPNATAVKDWEDIMRKILAAALVSSLLFLAEKLVIQLISINYHRKQFNARIKESKRNVYLLGLLYEASRSLFPAYCNEFAEEDYTIADQLDLSRGLGSKHRSRPRSGAVTPMRIIQDIGRYGDKITSAFGNVAHEITGKEVFNPNSAHSVVVEALEKKRSAEALAKRIWMSFVVEGREALFQDDVMEVLGENRRTEAEESFAVLDRDANGDVSLDEMIQAVIEFSRERKSIASSMHDVDQAINVLDRLLATVVFVAVIFVFVAFLNANFTTTLATTGTALLSLSFVFSATCQEVLGSCIFLFVKHPYDIGDRVDIGADQFTVEHISLLFTVFRRVSGTGVGRSAQVPNIVLNTLWIENVSRSKAMSEQLHIDVDFTTSFEDIQILKNELQTFITDKENSRDFQSQIEVGVLGTSDQSKLSLQVEIKHKSNWANETIRQARRSKFMCALVSALRAVPIYPPGGGVDPQGSAANPAYSVAVSDEQAKESVAASAKARKASRLIPLKTDDELARSPTNRLGTAGLTLRDNKILDDLNFRDPASDPARDEAWSSSRDDSETLGERPSIDPQDLEDVKGMLRRESTRGRRKAGQGTVRYTGPSIPTISEPQHYGTQYEYESPVTNSSTSTTPRYLPEIARQRTLRMENSQSTSQGPSLEMRQTPAKRSDSLERSPLSPTAGPGHGRSEASYENMRPYSGV